MTLDGSGPLYPALGATVARLRRSADRHAHGTAVLDAIRALQARELAGALEPAARSNCASGTAATDGDGILAAIRRSQAAVLAGARGPVRTPEDWTAAYAEAMAAKRAEAARHGPGIISAGFAAATEADLPNCAKRQIDSNACLKPPRNQTRKPARSVNHAPIPPVYSLPRIMGAVGVSFC